MSIATIGYLRIASTDIPAWMSFGTDILGLMDAGRDDPLGARFLRMDDHPFRFMLEPGAEDGLLACGLECRSKTDWLVLCERLREAGYTLAEGDSDAAARRCVTGFVSLQDPCGNNLELFYGRRLDYTPLISPAGVRRFITGDEYGGDLGFGHAVLPAPDSDAAAAFYIDLLGMGVSDLLYPPMPEGAPETSILFLHADNPRQHSLALYNHPYPGGVVHVMVEVETLDEVGRALDRARAAGHTILASMGRHVNDNMCSFYVLAPGGIAIEYGYDGLLVDWSTYTPTVSTVGDLWGHEYQFPGG